SWRLLGGRRKEPVTGVEQLPGSQWVQRAMYGIPPCAGTSFSRTSGRRTEPAELSQNAGSEAQYRYKQYSVGGPLGRWSGCSRRRVYAEGSVDKRSDQLLRPNGYGMGISPSGESAGSGQQKSDGGL